MLFQEFQDLQMDSVGDSEVENHDSNTYFNASNTSSVMSHHTFNMSNRM